MYFFMHFVLGFVTNAINNLTEVIVDKKYIPIINYSNNKSKIIGIWKISGNKNHKDVNPLLGILYKIPYDCKCTFNMIYCYAYTLGRLCTSFYFWNNFSEIYQNIAFTPFQLYTLW